MRLTLLTSTAALALVVACGGGQQAAAPASGASPGSTATAAPDIAANSASTAYFHEQLVTNGEEVQTDFGSALLTLGMNPRDLQQDTPEHAYQTAREKVDEVKDEVLKRDLARALFGPTPAR